MTTETPTNQTIALTLEYIKKDIGEIKGDVKEMKSDYVSRREFDEKLKQIEDKFVERFTIPLKIIYTTGGIVGTSVLYAILKLIRL
jgi:hypothetical protein